MNRLAKYKDRYNFNCQIFDGDYNIYISRDNVDLRVFGGYEKWSDAVDAAIEWLEHINR